MREDKIKKSRVMVVDQDSAEGYEWGVNCKAWALLEDEELSVKQEYMPAGSGESLHMHHKAQQFFYVLNGEATMEVENEKYTLKPRQGMQVLAGSKHRIMNETKEAVDFLVISTPATKEDRTEIC